MDKELKSIVRTVISNACLQPEHTTVHKLPVTILYLMLSLAVSQGQQTKIFIMGNLVPCDHRTGRRNEATIGENSLQFFIT